MDDTLGARRPTSLTALDGLIEALATPLDRATLREVLGRRFPAVVAADVWRLILCDEEAFAAPGLAGVVLRQNCPLRTADYLAECARHGLAPSASDETAARHWLGAPVAVERSVLGVLALGRHADPFTADEQALLATAARVVALALRTADLAAAGERTAQELHAAADEIARGRGLAVLGEVAASVVHDFNNTLAAILIHAEILTAESEPPELARHVEVIHTAALEGARAVRRLRDLAQPRRPRPFRRVDLNEQLVDVVAVTRVLWRDQAQARNVTYDVTVERSPVAAVSADAVELGDALTMLVLRALAAMPRGGRIALRTGADGDRVFCSLTSDAPAGPAGEDPDVPARVLEIAHRHGGEVAVGGAAGSGRTLTLWFPAMARAPEPTAAAGAPRREAKVLLIDDEPSVREALREALTRLGHRVVTCSGGREGLDSLRGQAFDLVLTDLTMPDMSGWEVAREVKRGRPATPVVLVTGWGDEVDPEEAKALGIDAVLAKPVTTRALRAIIEGVLRPPRRRRAERVE